MVQISIRDCCISLFSYSKFKADDIKYSPSISFFFFLIYIIWNLPWQKSSLESTLQETNERYAAQLAGHQAVITGLEAQILNLTNSITEMQLKYGTLLDLKTRLEAEIVEYRRLLDGEDDR